MRFLRRPRPGVNEILSSYLLRVTGANGYANYKVVSEYVDLQSDLHKFNYTKNGLELYLSIVAQSVVRQ